MSLLHLRTSEFHLVPLHDDKLLKGRQPLFIIASVTVVLVDRKMIDRDQHFPCFNSSSGLFSASKAIDFSIKYENRHCGEAAEVSVN